MQWLVTKPSGVLASVRRYLDEVLGDEALRSSDDIRLARLRLFVVLGLLSTGYYSCHDVLHGSYWTAGLHSVAFLLLGVSGFLLRDSQKVRFVSHLVIALMTILLGVIPLWDGHIHAPGLWPLVLVSAVAGFLFKSKVVVRYALLNVAMVLMNWGLGPYFDHLPRVTGTDAQWLQLRVITLVVFGGLIVIGAASSIRARKRIEIRTQAMWTRAQEENVAKRSKSVFLATMSSELQVPMIGLARLAERMRACASKTPLSQPVEEICASAARLVHILASVSDLAHLEAGTVELSEAPFTIGVLLDALGEQFSDQARAKDLSLRITDEFGPKTLRGDPKRIYQVVASLVDNAIKFSDEGQIQVHVVRGPSLSSQESELCTLVIRVRDQGIGMNEAQRQRVFGRFEQVHPEEKRQRGGCGLGLAVSQRLVRLMGGRLEVESEEEKESVFTCTLPLKVEDVDQTDADLSTVLGFDWIDARKFEEKEELAQGEDDDSGDEPELGGFVRVVAPLILVFLARAAFHADLFAAMMHGLCFVGLAICGARVLGKRLRAGVWLAFVVIVAVSIVSQSILDASLYSEALWSVVLTPIIVAYAFGLRYASLAAGFAAAVIALVAARVAPGVGFELGQDPVLFTVATRFAFILAVVGSSDLIMRGSRAKILALQEEQASVREIGRAAKEANEEKDRFFSRIAEEIGAPLRTILEIADTKTNKSKASPKQVELLNRTSRCARAIFCLLDRSLLRAGAENPTRLDPEGEFDLRQLVEDACLLFQDEAQSRNIDIKVEDSQNSRWVRGDCARVLELLTLMMSYTLSAANAGSVVLVVKDIAAATDDRSALRLEWRCEANRAQDLLARPERDRAWARAQDTARLLGGELQCLGEELGVYRSELAITFDLQARSFTEAA